MKFTNGYWVVKPEYEINFAVESFRARKTPDGLEILAATAPASHRGQELNHAMLTVRFSSPMPDVIRVEVEHHRGTLRRDWEFDLTEEMIMPVITENESCYTVESGRAKAIISKEKCGWTVTYTGDDRVLTQSGYHAMAHARRRDDGRTYMIDSLTLDVGEKVYGLGERFTAFVKNGQSIDMWNEDGGTSSELAYKNVPFYMTNRGYGVFVQSSSDVSYEVASEKVERVQFSLPGERLVYDVIYGETPKGVLERYTALTGRPALPPAWSFGLWLSTSFTTDYDEATVSAFVDGMAQRDLPMSVLHLDCFWMKGGRWCDFEWDEDVFPDPRGMLSRLKDRGLRICCWINPYIAQDSRLFDEGMEMGYLLKKENGDVWQTDMWQPGMAILDVTNPMAQVWYRGHLHRLLKMGVDAFKTDFGERIPVAGVRWHDGSDPLAMHNRYAYLYNQMVFESLEGWRSEGDAVVFARSATAGGQKFPVHWNGDSTASYISMAETLRSGLSLSQCGFGFWSHDMGGFEQTAPADVYKRWAAFGMLCSHSRLHGSSSYRVPWLFDEESCDVLRLFTKLKYRLMPYLYRAAVVAHQTGVPVLRPMMMEFPDDVGCEDCDRQYMLGDSLLVAPVFHADGHVDYYLPKGRWTSLLTGEVIEGGGWRRETHDFMSLPLLAREGSVIPMGAADDCPDYSYEYDVRLHVYEPVDGVKTVIIPNLRGETAAAFRLTVKDGEVSVDTTSRLPYQMIVHRA